MTELRRRVLLGVGVGCVIALVGYLGFVRGDSDAEPSQTAAESTSKSTTTRPPTAERTADADAQIADALGDAAIVQGRDGWLFFGEDVSPPCASLVAIGDLDRLDLGPDQLRYFVDQPASAFYPDEFEPADAPDPCVAEEREALRKRLASERLAIDVDAALREVADRGTEVFFRTDTHWTPEARIVVAEQLIEALAPGVWDPDAVVIAEQPRTNDLGIAVDVAAPATVTGPTVERGEVTVLDRRVVEKFGPDFVNRGHTRSDAEPTIPGVTYIVGDSQLAYLLPQLQPYFEELVFLNWFLADLGATEFPDLPDPDRLVVQSIDRYAAERFEHPLLAGLAARLPD